MNKANPDEAARQRIKTDLETNLLVEAGAGSGKTHELAARMAAGIASGTYELERMAAVTFTRKAAAELRGRFQLALEAELGASRPSRSSRLDPERSERIQAALSSLEKFFAGTIHAFCARLLRERPVEAGVSPGFTELDDVEERMLREQSWRDYRVQAKASGDPDLMELLEAGISAKQLDKAFATICLYEDVTFPGGDAPMPPPDKAWQALEAFWKSLGALLPDVIDPGAKCATLARAQRFRRQWRARERGRSDAALLVDLLTSWSSQPNVTLKWWDAKPDAKAAEALHAAFRTDVVLPFLTSWRQYLYGRCVALLSKARDAARHDRRRRNTLSFNDLLIVTAEVLRTNAEVRRSLQHKYHWLLVDEFQDTDPVQAEIMFLLAADEPLGHARGGPLDSARGGPLDHTMGQRPTGPARPERSRGANWRTIPLRPGALFVVGDPKQSIYRFRRADIDVYNEVRARIGGPKDEGLVRLTTNFRSVPGLCEWANDVFKTRFPESPTTFAPMFAALDASREPAAGKPQIAVIEIGEQFEGLDIAREEARRIARYIRSEVSAGRRQYGDFLILTRKKKGLRPYAEELEALEVPIEVTGAGAFGESEEVRVLALLLTALCDPQDSVSLVGVLRGSLFGLSDRDLFAFRQARGYFNLFATAAGPAEALAKAGGVSRALESLRRWHTWARRLPAGAALERILEDSGYLALGAASHGGVEAGDLLHAVDRVRTAIEGGFTLAEAAEALAAWSGLEDDDDALDESTEVDSLPLEPGRRDVVRLMNLHKAKGLEADVVFLADPLGGFEPRVDARIVRTEGGSGAVGYFRIVEAKDYGQKVLAEPAGWAAYEATERQYLQAEADRLLYVAATRARDTLVVGRWVGNAGRRKPAWDAFLPCMKDAPALDIPAQVKMPAPVVGDLSAATALTARNALEVTHDLVRRPTWSATSVTAEVKRLPANLIEEVADDASTPHEPEDHSSPTPDPTRVVVPDSPSHRADAGLAWGALVHGLLEHAMRHPAATRDDLRRLAMWLTVENDEPGLRAVIDLALDTVQSVAGQDFWKSARASGECHEEAPFAIKDTGSTPPKIVTGTIDLVHRTTDGWRVIDYKTDVELENPEAQGVYGEQAGKYAEAWGKVAGEQATAEVVGVRKGG